MNPKEKEKLIVNKMPRLSKSGIEYLDCQWGIFSGCYNWRNGICGVENCWAKSFALRFKRIYPNGFEPTFYPEALDSPKYLKKPSIIGVGWVGDVIGYGLAFKEEIYGTIEQCPQHRFLFLTKNPEDLINWEPFPDNCWVGVTATNQRDFYQAAKIFTEFDATVKYISVEPMQGLITFPDWIRAFLDWLIIGAQTKPYKPPKMEWVEEIVRAADKAGIPVFLKDNLFPLVNSVDIFDYRNLWSGGKANKLDFPLRLRQEMPVEK